MLFQISGDTRSDHVLFKESHSLRVASPFRLQARRVAEPRKPRLACIKQRINRRDLAPPATRPFSRIILWPPQSAPTFSAPSLRLVSALRPTSTSLALQMRPQARSAPASGSPAPSSPCSSSSSIARPTRRANSANRSPKSSICTRRSSLPPFLPRALTGLHQGAQGRDDMVPESPPERAQGFPRRRLGLLLLSAGPSDAAQAALVHPQLALVALCADDAAREAPHARGHGPAL